MRSAPVRAARSCATVRAPSRWAAPTGPKRRCWPWSSSKPASSQPIVPLRSAATGFGMPALTSDCAPIRLRVRPAQLTTMRVAGSGARSRARSTSSAPGTLVPVGMLIVRYSSQRRTSSTTMSVPASSSAFTSSAGSDGVPASCSTSSPKDLLGTLTSRNSSPPLRRQPSSPPSSRLTAVQPAAASQARGRFGQAFAVVVDHHRHVAARQPPGRVELEPRARDLHREQRVLLRERVFLAHVEQRDLAALQQHRAHVVGGQPRQLGFIFTSSQTAR
jgi:hypothetical protein